MRGPGTNVEQIARLKEKAGDSGLVVAEGIVRDLSPNVIALAYKLMRVNTAKNKLPKNVDKMLSNLSEKDAEMVRGKLAEAHIRPPAPVKAEVRG